MTRYRCARLLAGLLLVLVLGAGVWGDDPRNPLQSVKTLDRQYQEALEKFRKEYDAAPYSEREKIRRQKHPDTARYAAQFLAYARQAPSSPAALDALVWVATHPLGVAPADDPRPEALRLLRRYHITNAKLGAVCTTLVVSADEASEDFLRDVIRRTRSKSADARAILSLAQNLRYRARIRIRLYDADAARQYESVWGRAAVRLLLERDPKKLTKESEKLFEKVIARYKTMPHPTHGTLGALAATSLEAIRKPVEVGREAPDITGKDVDGKELSLRSQRGKVVLLDFWGDAYLPCQAAYATERALVRRMAKQKDFVMLGVNGDVRETALRVRKAEQLTWPSWCDGGPRGPIATRWDVEVWPTLYLIDRKGEVRYQFLGWPEPPVLSSAIADLLREGKGE